MEYLKIILYILVFPGLIFSSFMGFFISGLDRKIVAKMQRRRGPKISQSFYDFIKLLGKETIIPSNANRKLFIIAPIIAVVSIVIIPLFIPVGNYTFKKYSRCGGVNIFTYHTISSFDNWSNGVSITICFHRII